MSTTPPDDLTAAPTQDGRRRRRIGLVIALFVVVLVVDQLTKLWAVAALTDRGRVDVLGDLLGLRLLYNPGAALSIATGMTWVLTVIACGVVVVVVRAARRLGSTTWAVALGLLLGGAVGNLVDRLVREPGVGRGHVVDFIAYGNLFVGNVADIAIVVAAGLVMVQALRGVHLDGTRDHVGAGDAPADDAESDADGAVDPGSQDSRPGTGPQEAVTDAPVATVRDVPARTTDLPARADG